MSSSPAASPPPSPRSLEQTAQFFAVDQEPACPNPKRPRIVVETLDIPDTQNSDLWQQMRSTTPHPGSGAIVAPVPETLSQSVLIPGTLASQDESNSCSDSEHNGQSAAMAPDSEHNGQFAAMAPQIPPEWTAGNGVVVNLLCSTYFYSPDATGDGSFKIKFQWESATAETALTFLTSGILGTQSKRGMGNYLRHALKSLVKLTDKDSPAQLFFAGLLNARQKAISSSHHKDVEFKRHFKTAFDACKAGFISEMNKYVLVNPVKLYMTTNDADDCRLLPIRHLPQHSEINALARVVVLMSDPQVLPTVFMRVYFHTTFTGAANMAGSCK